MLGVDGLRERKKVETRRAIAEAALRLATELGLDGFTVDDIAAAAGVSSRTVFNYFATKDDAILGVDPTRRAEIAAAVEARPAHEAPIVALRTVLVAVTTDPQAGEVWRRRAVLTRAHPRLQAARAASQALYERALAEAIARRTGLDAGDVYPRLIVGSCLAAVRAAVDHNEATGHADDPAHLAKSLATAFAALERGLTPPPKPKGSRSNA